MKKVEKIWYYPNDDVAYESLEEAVEYLKDQHEVYNEHFAVEEYTANLLELKHCDRMLLKLVEDLEQYIWDKIGEENYNTWEYTIQQRINKNTISKALTRLMHGNNPENNGIYVVGKHLRTIPVTKRMFEED